MPTLFTYKAGVGRQRHDSVPLYGEVVAVRRGVGLQQRVDQPEQLHDPLVLAQVLVPLQQEHVAPPVRALNCQASRPLLRLYHLDGEVNKGISLLTF